MSSRVLLLVLVVFLTIPSLLPGQERARGPIIARGAERDAIRSTHILNRPYRPLHFYGNTVRRRHARG
jgi:hypothetical protein